MSVEWQCQYVLPRTRGLGPPNLAPPHPRLAQHVESAFPISVSVPNGSGQGQGWNGRRLTGLPPWPGTSTIRGAPPATARCLTRAGWYTSIRPPVALPIRLTAARLLAISSPSSAKLLSFGAQAGGGPKKEGGEAKYITTKYENMALPALLCFHCPSFSTAAPHLAALPQVREARRQGLSGAALHPE